MPQDTQPKDYPEPKEQSVATEKFDVAASGNEPDLDEPLGYESAMPHLVNKL